MLPDHVYGKLRCRSPAGPGRWDSTSGERGATKGQLFAAIRKLVAADKYVFGKHAAERLEERGIMEWQVVAGVDDGELIVERPAASPKPVVEVRETLPDGMEFKAVWSHLRRSGVAKLVTVRFFDEDW